ncbi:MAG TPA: metallopeptidase TldD-related protein [Methanospirillum sp.]|nr:metallopeptidase TldD-related protein [Methanospirillum sp.]
MFAEEIIRAGRDQVDEVEVFFSTATSISADLKREKIAIGSISEGSGLIIRVIKDGKVGVSSTNNPATWRKTLDAAIASSSFADRVDWKGLPGPIDLDQRPLACDPAVEAEPDILTDLLERMLTGSLEYEAQVTGGGVTLSSGSQQIINSNGLSYEVPSTHVSLSLEMIAGQSTGFEHDSSWKLSEINPEKIGETAAFFAAKGQNGDEIETGTYDIVLSPVAISQLLSAAIIPALSGKNVHTGRSFFAGKIGDMVMDSHASLIDDPFDSRGISNCRWDDEGMPVQKTVFVQNGVLQSFAYDLKTAYLYGEKPTAHGVRTGIGGSPGIGEHNLILTAKTDNIMAEDAVYVHDLIGAHTANPMSGDFSVEFSSPFFIRDGELDRPIRTGMLSGNVFELFKQIEGSSVETRTLGSLIIPSVRISDVTIVGRG